MCQAKMMVYCSQPELLYPPGILSGNGSFINNQVGKVQVNRHEVFLFLLLHKFSILPDYAI